MEKIILILFVTFTCVNSLNFLMIPQPSGSHIIMLNRMGAALIHQGHSVSMVLPDNVKPRSLDANIHIHKYAGVGDSNILHSPELNDLFVQIKFASSMLESLKLNLEMDATLMPTTVLECKNLMNDNVLRDELLSEKFDFAIVDSIGFPCIMNYPITLGVDYFLFSVPMFGLLYRVPELPSFTPGPFGGMFSDEMGFVDRLINTLYTYTVFYVFLNTTNAIDMTQYPPFQPIPDMGAINDGASLWFWLSDSALSFPRPHMPNTISIGDIMITESNPLPENFQQFMDQSPEGVILLSLGSMVDHMPADVLGIFCEAFTKVPQKIIWKTNEPPPCTAQLQGKMMVVNWTPQNDVLAHPNLKLFMTHCGWNSMLEAVYHAKPMLGFPIGLDQPDNAIMMEKLGYGISLDLAHFSSDDALTAVDRILSNNEFHKKVQFGSALLKDKPNTAEKRLDYWVRHVAKYGSDHLKTGGFKLKLYEFMLLDVYATLMTITIISLIIVVYVIWCSCKCFRKCCCSKGTSKQKKE